jgi:hypothetical protein
MIAAQMIGLGQRAFITRISRAHPSLKRSLASGTCGH